MCLFALTSSLKSAFLFLSFPGFREEPKKRGGVDPARLLPCSLYPFSSSWMTSRPAMVLTLVLRAALIPERGSDINGSLLRSKLRHTRAGPRTIHDQRKQTHPNQ
ncbi:hypothetical protein EGJ18_19305 [Stutzerimonas stutzeri]|nr:hypothetical protein EGJ18_19305 [Stutzerimonas stutzeri]